jgi:hypothetical protein
VTFLLLNKKVEKFQLCLKTAASLFSFSCVTFLISFIHFSDNKSIFPVGFASQKDLGTDPSVWLD